MPGAVYIPIGLGRFVILFSHDIFGAQATGGISRCMIELMAALSPARVDWRLWAGRHMNLHLQHALEHGDFASRVSASAYVSKLDRVRALLVNETRFARAARRASVVHRTYYPIIDAATAKVPTVHTLHDMWDARGARDGDRSARMRNHIKRRGLERAAVIACVSNSTLSELALEWPDLARRAVVVPHGVRPLSASPIPYQSPRRFFLFVGRRGLYKNFRTAAAALALLSSDYELLCVGGGPFSPSERHLIAELRLEGRVSQREADDAALAGLYAAAAALLYPSAYEGFGLPLLEAMIHGCPVIAAPLTSLPEVGGDAALYADPSSPMSWADAMRDVFQVGGVADDLRRRGRKRAAEFSWAATASSYAAAYDVARRQ